MATVTSAAQTAATGGNDAFRQRLLAALAESITRDGYRATTVASIVRRARTSRRTFYEHFADKEACFLALLAEKNQDLIRAVTDAIDFHSPWEVQVRQAITAYITTVEAEPELAVSWIRELPSLGTRARALQREMLESFVTLVQALSETEEMKAAGIPPVSRQVAVIMLGGLLELIAWTVEDGDPLSGIIETSVQSATALLRAGLAP